MLDAPADILDAVFAISCPRLPVDHAYALQQAIQAALPWFADEPQAGLHAVHGAASGSGWMRPEGEHALLQLPGRTKLVLRLPGRRMPDAAALTGLTLDVAGWPMRVGRLSPRPLPPIASLFSRGVLLAGADNEEDFLAAAARELGALGIAASTMLCGRDATLATPQRVHRTRSLMVKVAVPAQSLTLQRHGLGDARKLGCGLFIPHKDVGDLRRRED